MTSTLDDFDLDEGVASGDLRHEVAILRNELADTQTVLELRTEAFEELARNYDEAGWDLLGSKGWANGKGFRLDSLKKMADVNQQLLINPLIKRAIGIRNSYVFGEGIRFGKLGQQKRSMGGSFPKFQKINNDVIFAKQACQEMETALCTDGNLFLLLDKKQNKVIRLSFSEITGIVAAKGNPERKLYIQRTWSEPRSGIVGDTNEETHKVWYPVAAVQDSMTPQEKQWTDATDEQARVDHTLAILHVCVNRQINWLWGMADLQPVVFWAKAYKEALESQYVMLRALSRWALKVTAPSAAAAKRTAAKLAIAPVTDVNGRPLAGTTGATATLGGGEDLQAVSKAGANVDFGAPQPLAAMVAAGMEVSLEHLLSDPGVKSVGQETLVMPTVKAMSSRQSVFRAMYETIFDYFGLPQTEIVFPPIQAEPIHRIIQAIVTAASTNGLHPEEIREMLVLALRLYGVDPKPELPKPGQYAQFVSGIDPNAALPTAPGGVNKNPGTSPQKTPDASGGRRSPSGPLADGDHSMRPSESGSLGTVEHTKVLLNQLLEMYQ